ncbi:hypothetical protein FRC04_005118 [Tulasnella sp. 424]|nr:hypothetical protein FRC04_005118 [Tulasnella sp. 424]
MSSGHLKLNAFAHLIKRSVKVIQPGLVNSIEWRTTLSVTREAVIIPVILALDNDPPINSPKNFNEEEPRKAAVHLRHPCFTTPNPLPLSLGCAPPGEVRGCRLMNRRRMKDGKVSGRSVAGVELKRSKGMVRDVMRSQVDLRRGGGDAEEEEGEEGEGDDERAEELLATLLPPRLTASQSTEDDEEEEEDYEEDHHDDENDGASAPDSTSTSHSAPISAPSLSTRHQSK